MSAQPSQPRWRPAALHVVIAALGVLTIVGSGGGLGGSEGAPSACFLVYCEIPGSGGSTLPPQIIVSIQPPYLTVVAGTQVSYAVQVSNAPAGVTFQWSRSSDEGVSFVDIAGATGPTYVLNGATLADDGAVFRVKASAAGGIPAFARTTLAVSPSPGLVFQDGEFAPQDWLVTPLVDAAHPAFVHGDERVTSGGSPDAWRKTTDEVPQGSSKVTVFYASLPSVYDPAARGPINVIDYAEYCNKSSEAGYAISRLVVEQAGRRYVPMRRSTGDTCLGPVWSSGPSVSTLRPREFEIVDGPACNAAEACPDFSSAGQPLRFGYRREAYRPGETVVHGIDNWTVTVWRK